MNYSAPMADDVAGSGARSAKRWRAALSAIGLALVAAVVVAGFMAYLNPSMLLSLENLRLCY